MPFRKALNHLYDNLWAKYRKEVPYADRYVELVEAAGGRAVNDHVALRSFNVDLPMQPSGIEAARRIFETLGYVECGQYDFPQTHLTAIHMEHDELDLPRVFISQLEVDRLPDDVARLIREATAIASNAWAYPDDVIHAVRGGMLSDDQAGIAGDGLAAFFRRPWNPPLRASIAQINEVSQYAAWTLLHGNAVNHFTASINGQNVAKWGDIEATVDGLREAGVPMKDAIEGAPGSKLRQSSTKAVQGEFEVTEADGRIGTMPWTYAYYELAQRGFVERADGTEALFSGFLGEQTTGLFNMTSMT